MTTTPFAASELFKYRFMPENDAASLDLRANLQIAEDANNAIIRLADGLRAFGRIGAVYGVSAVKIDSTMECAFSLVEEVSDLISSLVGVADAALERVSSLVDIADAALERIGKT